EGEARRVLRAASIFGDAFTATDVGALLGPSGKPQRTAQWLSTLADREVLVPRPERARGGEQEYRFRHPILREAAYAMLTDGDRILGHRLAAEHLEARGDADPMVLAEHLERAHLPERAGAFYLDAARRALRGGDADATLRRARRGLTGDVSPE